MSDLFPRCQKRRMERLPPYQVLARKYRPQSFEDLIGHEAMVRTLNNAFAADRIAHAYILTGVRGVGKTTTARILARALNYVGPNGAKITARRWRWPKPGPPLQIYRRKPPSGCAGNGRRLAHRRRRHSRTHRGCALCAGGSALQGLHYRRSAHAVDGGVQCAV